MSKIRSVKIRVNSVAESKAIQESLLQTGCSWADFGRRVQYETKPYLYVDTMGIITYGEGDSWFNSNSNRELKFEFTTTVKAVPVARKTTMLFGKLYDAEELQAALDNLKTVEV